MFYSALFICAWSNVLSSYVTTVGTSATCTDLFWMNSFKESYNCGFYGCKHFSICGFKSSYSSQNTVQKSSHVHSLKLTNERAKLSFEQDANDKTFVCTV